MKQIFNKNYQPLTSDNVNENRHYLLQNVRGPYEFGILTRTGYLEGTFVFMALDGFTYGNRYTSTECDLIQNSVQAAIEMGLEVLQFDGYLELFQYVANLAGTERKG